MSDIKYRKIKPDEVPIYTAIFGDYITQFGCMNFGDGCYSLGAFDGDKPVGFISACRRYLMPPLGGMTDAFIDAIEVDAAYRRKGIARTMIRMTEDWARVNGFRQIRAWSSADRIEAIPMWYSLGYCVCPAHMHGDDLDPDTDGKMPAGYYVAKVLSSETNDGIV